MQASTISSHTTRQAVEAGRLGLDIDKCLQEKDVSGTCSSCFSSTCSDLGALGALFRALMFSCYSSYPRSNTRVYYMQFDTQSRDGTAWVPGWAAFRLSLF
jgi:hypothetical protein